MAPGADAQTSAARGWRRHAAAVWPGAMAGLLSKVLTHPMDTVKANLQIQGAVHGARRTNPWRMPTASLFRGIGAVALGTAPCSAAYYASYEHGKAIFGDTATGGLLTGLYAQLLAGVVFTPVDVLKERLQVSWATQGPANLPRVLAQCAAEGGLWRGYWVNTATWLPWNAVHVALYEEGKRRWRCASQSEDVPSPACASIALASSSTAALLTSPLDVVKTRVQTLQSANPAQVARDLLAREGARSFFAGAQARVLSMGPATALSWFLYESFSKVAATSVMDPND